jgi:hypothetical protein
MSTAGSGGIVSLARRALRGALWVLLVLVILFLALVIWDVPRVARQEKSQQVVAQIQSQHLTMQDADGSDLPPAPDPKLADATVAGIDANHNGIRDDVELAIFQKYPGPENFKLRAAELQYAMELQFELTDVSDSNLLVAAMRAENRGYLCIDNRKEGSYVENLEFNTAARKTERENIYRKYMTTYSVTENQDCDI